MSPVLGIIASSTQQGRSTAVGSYDALASVTLGASASSIIFAGVPTGYQHLELRGILRTDRGTYGIDNINMIFNNDTSSSYSNHQLVGEGSGSGASYPSANASAINITGMGTTAGSSFGGLILTIMNYASTTGYKSTQALTGADLNGTVAGYGGAIALNTGNWRNTAAITNIKITPQVGTNFVIYSSLALYGVK